MNSELRTESNNGWGVEEMLFNLISCLIVTLALAFGKVYFPTVRLGKFSEKEIAGKQQQLNQCRIANYTNY